MLKQDIKLRLYEACESYLKDRLAVIEHRLNELNDSLEAETKSSVGDKYETGRAMLHLEKDKQMQQLAVLLSYKQQLHAIEPNAQFFVIEQGALVKTNHGLFYIAISAGKLTIDQQVFFAITLASPIGKLLFQKKVGDQFSFRGRDYQIEEVR
ncbi:hypothetical protein [Aureispira anguillae]|uniref:3-oxoacyl-ACP synthase n=1 Tax=Aureispira anguillae TaxID=2864201 RepID=A0A915YHT6_9BACT|nr:hypothetical protein [Aureispira anguillae]BDS13231.1 hypothetical protein AsAng_0039600 [Aureispira anguillae]